MRIGRFWRSTRDMWDFCPDDGTTVVFLAAVAGATVAN